MDLLIREIRLEKDLKQVVVARRAGIDPKTLSAIETGKQSPRSDTLKKIAAALGCNVSDFFDVAPTEA